ELVSLVVAGIVREAILSAYLAEFARPVREDYGAAFVSQVRFAGTIRPIVTSSEKPAPLELIFAGCKHAKGTLFKRLLLTLAPDELTTSHERVVNRPTQRLPTQGCVNSIQTSDEVRAQFVVSAGIRGPDLKVRRFGQILVTAQMCHRADVALAV